MKEEANSRLSNLLTEDTEKEEAHKRLWDAVRRLNKQESAFNNELSEIKNEKINIDEKIKSLLEEHSSLEGIAEREMLRINNLESKQQVCLVLKICWV